MQRGIQIARHRDNLDKGLVHGQISEEIRQKVWPGDETKARSGQKLAETKQETKNHHKINMTNMDPVQNICHIRTKAFVRTVLEFSFTSFLHVFLWVQVKVV